MARYSLPKTIIYMLIDTAIIALCAFVPYVLRHNDISLLDLFFISLIWPTLNLPEFTTYALIFTVWGLLTIILHNINHLYETNRELTIPREVWLVSKSVFYATVTMSIAVLLLKIQILSRLVIINFAISMTLLMSLWRTIKRLLVRQLVATGYNNLNVLIIGAGRIGEIISQEIKRRPYLGLRVCGYLDDKKPKGSEVNGSEVTGKISDFERVVRRKFIDEAYVTIPSQRRIVSELVIKGKNLGVGVKIVPDLYDIAMGELHAHQIGFLPVLEYHNKGIHGTDLLVKRSMDIVISLILLILLLPFLLIIALLIKIDSRGPVFYVSSRCGKKSKAFKFYKFRSMLHNSERLREKLRVKNEKDGPIFKMRKDPRVTKVGKILRKYSLDELPQLWNVLKGDMSLVGPRPPTLDEVDRYDDLHLRRLEIRPGITCLWQVKGRSELSFSEWVELDIWYIDHWSFWLDIKILLWTIPAVLKGKGAY
ncbi:MAG: sugar transferase [Candidatus Omnitrophota bacterium]